jgi:predicted  nucleic acid-binding Zn-ribbon protein
LAISLQYTQRADSRDTERKRRPAAAEKKENMGWEPDQQVREGKKGWGAKAEADTDTHPNIILT